MIIEEITVTAFQQHTRIVGCEETKQAICIDPGDEASVAERTVKLNREAVRGIDRTGGTILHTSRRDPRTAAFKLSFQDVTVALDPGQTTATVHLTAEFVRRSITTGEESLDAREFSLGMKKVSGDWRIASATAIQVLK